MGWYTCTCLVPVLIYSEEGPQQGYLMSPRMSVWQFAQYARVEKCSHYLGIWTTWLRGWSAGCCLRLSRASENGCWYGSETECGKMGSHYLWPASAWPYFQWVQPAESMWRNRAGASLSDGSAMIQAPGARCSDLNRALDRFPLISAHYGLIIPHICSQAHVYQEIRVDRRAETKCLLGPPNLWHHRQSNPISTSQNLGHWSWWWNNFLQAFREIWWSGDQNETNSAL